LNETEEQDERQLLPYQSSNDNDYIAASRSSDADGLPIDDDDDHQQMGGD